MLNGDSLRDELDRNSRPYRPGANGLDHRADEPPLPFSILHHNARTMFAGAAPPQSWLIDGVIPLGKAGMAAAAGDTGKSFTAMELCLRVTQGPVGEVEAPIFGGFVRSYGAAVFLTAEDGKASVHRRIHALDPDGRRQATSQYALYVVALPDAGGPFPIVSEERGKAVVTPQFHELRMQLRAIPHLKLVVIDPLQCFAHADVNADPQAAAIVMATLNMLAAETGAAVLVTHHVRKEREAPKSAQEARFLIRGSSALVDQARFAIVLWTPDDAETRRACRLLKADFAPNAIVHGAVVKSNDGASRERWTLLRGANGILRDVTHALRNRGADREKQLLALIHDIGAAAEDGRPFTRTGVNGLYQRRAELGEELRELGRDRLDALATELEQDGRIVLALASGSTSVKWLDLPEGPFARGDGEFAPGASKARAGRRSC